MILNQLKLVYPYCAWHTKKEMHSRDTTVLIDYFDLTSCTIPFSTFFDLATIVHTLLENS